MAFPQRSAQADFLQYFSELPSDDEEAGIGLDEAGSDDDADAYEGCAGDVDGLIGEDEVLPADAEAQNKRLDAQLRANEEKQLEALARRFEDRAKEDEMRSRPMAAASAARARRAAVEVLEREKAKATRLERARWEAESRRRGKERARQPPQARRELPEPAAPRAQKSEEPRAPLFGVYRIPKRPRPPAPER